MKLVQTGFKLFLLDISGYSLAIEVVKRTLQSSGLLVTRMHARFYLISLQSKALERKRRHIIVLKPACSELFSLDLVFFGMWLMIFQSICKYRIAVSFAFKQKRALQISAQPTLRFQVPRYCNNFSLMASATLSHLSSARVTKLFS